MNPQDAPETVHIKQTTGYAHNWWGVVTDCFDEDGVEYVRADTAAARETAAWIAGRDAAAAIGLDMHGNVAFDIEVSAIRALQPPAILSDEKESR